MATAPELPQRPEAGGPLRALAEATTEVVARDPDALDEAAIRDELAVLEDVRRRTGARQARLADTLRRRQARRLRDQGTDVARANQRATRQVQRELSERLSWAPPKAKQATTLGRDLEPSGPAGRAFDGGQITARHARVLAETLRDLDGDARDRVEPRLLEAARREDPVTFGKTCRRVLAELDHDAAMAAEHRRRARRHARLATTEDGMTVLSAQLSGVDAEIVHTAVHAHRRPDGEGERRTPEQATADALVEVARTALRAGEAPATHGVRPHVTVTIDHETTLADAGVAETEFTGPLPFGEVRRLLADAGVSRVLTDPAGVPLEAGQAVRTVPAGLWRALRVRDGGCIAAGCDAPTGWCEVMHLDVPYRLGGQLTPRSAALGCSEHHRKLDLHGWVVTWRGDRPVLHHPGRPPPEGASEPPGADPPARESPRDPPPRDPPPRVPAAGRRERGSRPG